MLETKLRQAANVLLESAIHIAPPDTRDWGKAMMGELNHVEGTWAGAMWALGSSSVLFRQALASLIVPSRRNHELVGDGGLFAKSASLSKSALVVGAVCVVVALMFFAAAPFRQAFEVALKPWFYVYQVASRNLAPGIEDLAKQAEKRHDPEGLAFCAARVNDRRECVRLADEAVRLDPSLIWVYAVVALHHPGTTDNGLRMEKLERWDPHNALLPLMTAVLRCHGRFRQGVWSPLTQDQAQAWRTAMGAAFQSTKFDDYLDRFAQLNRRVVPRYGFRDPYEVQDREAINISPIAFEISKWYAHVLIQNGADLEARGERTSARQEYWTVARFGQLLDSQGRTGAERWMGTTLQAMAYNQLQVSAGKEGNHEEAALFGYLAAKFDPGTAVRGESPWIPGQSAFGLDVARRSATVVEISGLMILIFSGLVVIAMSILIAGSRRSARAGVQRARPVATWVILSSAVGLLFSSVTLYLTYRPYWNILQSATLKGDGPQTRDLTDFLSSTTTLPGVAPNDLYHFLMDTGFHSRFLFYVWTGVTVLGLLSLALILLRHVLGRTRATATT